MVEVELSKSADAVPRRVFVDGSGAHTIATFTVAGVPEAQYLLSGWPKPRPLPRLRGVPISAVAFDAAHSSATTTGCGPWRLPPCTQLRSATAKAAAFNHPSAHDCEYTLVAGAPASSIAPIGFQPALQRSNQASLLFANIYFHHTLLSASSSSSYPAVQTFASTSGSMCADSSLQ